MALKPAKELFDDLGLIYEEAYGHNQGLVDFVKSSLERLSKDASVLDIGCGTGKPTSALVVESNRKLHGIDFSPVMIDLSRKQVPDATFELVNMLKFRPADKFDAAFAIFSLFQFSRDEITMAAQKFSQWIAPNGYLFIGTIVAEDFDFDTEPHLFDEDMLCAQGVEVTFMGKRIGISLYTKEGWKKLLEKFGFEVVKTEVEPFQSPPVAGGFLEPHCYITARKLSYLTLTE